jgi:hypothetical protein
MKRKQVVNEKTRKLINSIVDMLAYYVPEANNSIIQEKSGQIVVSIMKCGGGWRELFRLDTTFAEIEALDEEKGLEAATVVVHTFLENRHQEQFRIVGYKSVST